HRVPFAVLQFQPAVPRLTKISRSETLLLNTKLAGRASVMGDNESPKEIFRRAWKHIDAQQFGEAEIALRQVIALTDESDPIRLWELHGLLAGVLNSLSRTDEGTDMYRRALADARRAGDDHSAVGPARYMLANQ